MALGPQERDEPIVILKICRGYLFRSGTGWRHHLFQLMLPGRLDLRVSRLHHGRQLTHVNGFALSEIRRHARSPDGRGECGPVVFVSLKTRYFVIRRQQGRSTC